MFGFCLGYVWAMFNYSRAMSGLYLVIGVYVLVMCGLCLGYVLDSVWSLLAVCLVICWRCLVMFWAMLGS